MKLHGRNSHALIASVVLAAAGLSPVRPVWAATWTWTNPSGVNWSTAANWTSGASHQVPGSNDVAIIATTGIVITMNTNYTSGTALSEVSFDSPTGSATINENSSSFNLYTSSLGIGATPIDTGTATYNFSAGTLFVSDGPGVGGNGVYNQTGGTLSASSTGQLFSSGGTMSISGGVVNCAIFDQAVLKISGSATINNTISLLNGGTFTYSGGTLNGYVSIVGSSFVLNTASITAPGFEFGSSFSLPSNHSITATSGSSTAGGFTVDNFTSFTLAGTINTPFEQIVDASSFTSNSGWNFITGDLTVLGAYTLQDAVPAVGWQPKLTIGGNLTIDQDPSYFTAGTFTQSAPDALFTITGSLQIGSGEFIFSTGTLSPTQIFVGGYPGEASASQGDAQQSGGTISVTTNIFFGYNATDSGSYELSGGTLTTTASEFVGDSGNGGITQTGGTNHMGANLWLGFGANTTGFYSLSNSSSQLSDGNVYLGGGTNSQGTFIQSGGTHTVSGSVDVGYGTSTHASSYTLSGGSLSISGGLTIGNNAPGSFLYTGGTMSNIPGGILIAGNVGSSGTFTYSATSSLTTPGEIIGNAGNATFVQTSGTHSISGSLILANSPSVSVTYSLSAPGILSAGAETMASSGKVTFTQTGGTHSVTGTLYMAFQSGSSVNYSLSGSTSVLSANSEFLADVGSTTFTQAAGTHSVTNSLTMATVNGSYANYTLSTGLLSAGSETLGNVAFTHTNGTHTVVGAFSLGSLLGSATTYAMAAGSVSANSMTVAGAGGAVFTQATGATSVTNVLTIGTDAQGTGSMTISTGTLSAGSITLNRLGTLSDYGTLTTTVISSDGTLLISNPIVLTTLTLQNLSNTTIGSTLTVNGVFTENGGPISGPGSLVLTSTSTFNGFGAFNLVSVSNAGTLNAANGNLFIPPTTSFTNTGTIKNSVGANLFISSTTLTELGSITVNASGSVVFAQPITNNASQTITFLGGTLSTPALTNALNGNITGFGQLTGDLINNGTVNLSGPSQIVGNLTNNSGAHFNASNQQILITGNFTNNAGAFVKTTKSTIIYQGIFTNNGTYTSDPSDNYFGGLNVSSTGDLIGATGDTFNVAGDFITASTNANWNTTNSTLHFYNGTTHALTYTAQTVPLTFGTLTVDAGDTVNITGGANHALTTSLLDIHGSAKLLSGVLVSNSLSLAPAASGNPAATLDLVTNEMLLHTTLGATLRALLYSGQLTSSSDTSITRIGYIPGSNFLTFHPGSQFYGQNVVAGDTLARYTYAGDTNLDGAVTLQDYRLMDLGYLSGSTNATWISGDFNYDGVVDYHDYSLADAALHNQGSPLADQMIALHTTEFGSAYTNALQAAVPEPASLALLTLGMGGLLRLRRRV